MGTEDYSIIAKHQECFFVQTKSDKKTSRIHASDAKENHKIWNSILHMDIDVYMGKY